MYIIRASTAEKNHLDLVVSQSPLREESEQLISSNGSRLTFYYIHGHLWTLAVRFGYIFASRSTLPLSNIMFRYHLRYSYQLSMALVGA